MDTAVNRLIELLGPHLATEPDKTRDRIVTAAKQRFVEHGFARETIGRLCHDLHVSKKTFYKYFADRDDLVLAIVARNFSIIAPRIAEITASDLPPRERIDAVVDFLLGTVAKHFSVAFLADLQTLMPDVWEAINSFRLSQARRVIGMIEEGQRAGVCRDDIDPERLSRLLAVFVTRVVDPRTLAEHGLRLEDAVETMTKVLRYGIYTPEPKRAVTRKKTPPAAKQGRKR
ncbi:TetR/AcrR family transcriptional regulator [bacterium]|nr:TetR/AcrR family transcriptional regulator [bacterium]